MQRNSRKKNRVHIDSIIVVLFLLFCLDPLFHKSVRSDDSDIRVMSFNIRFGTANDGDNHWDKRKEFLFETIRTFSPDLLGTQETLAFQKDFLSQQLKDLEGFGVGRDDGSQAGEMAALFYRKSRFEKIDGGHFWLSPTPTQVGSKGWDAALPRIASWVKLKDRKSNSPSPILFLNTHFDHRGVVAREQSAILIRSKLQELGTGCRMIVTGDFNAAAKNSDPYKALFGASPDASTLLRDTYLSATSDGTNHGTFSGFKAENVSGPRIDWIGCSQDWTVISASIDRTAKNGATPSDHFPVNAVLK